MMALTTRRAFISGAVALITAPAIVRVESLMPIRALDKHLTLEEFFTRLGMDHTAAMSKAFEDMILYGQGAVNFDGLITRHIPIQEFFDGQ